MPLYEYECEACGVRFERIQRFSDKPVKICPECGGSVEKLLSSSAIQFKGTGWYVTDYAKKSGAPDGPGDAGKASSGEKGDKKGKGDKKEKKNAKPSSGSTKSSSSSATPK